MVKKLTQLLSIVIVFSSLTGCENIEDGNYQEPITVYEKINGSWSLSSLIFVDEFAKANNLEPVEQNLTDWFNFNSSVLHLNTDENNLPTDYSLEGDVPELFPASGYWELSSPFPTTNTKPISINLYSDTAKTVLTSRLRLISIPGAINTMEVQLQRISKDVVFASYNFKFFPIN